MFIIRKYLITEFVDKLVKTQVDLCFYFIIKELFSKVGQSIVSTVIVQVKGVEDISGVKN